MKISIKFFENKEVRAVGDEQSETGYFSIIDIISILSNTNNPLNYGTVTKTRMKKANLNILDKIKKFKLRARDGKHYSSDCLDQKNLLTLVENIPSQKSVQFIKGLIHSEDKIDELSKKRAYELFGSTLFKSLKPGTISSLQQIHSYLFGGLYDFAGKIRQKNISKQGFVFAPGLHLASTLSEIEAMPQNTFGEIVEKYIEMNIAHPFMEGNGRSTRIGLDKILIDELKVCIDGALVEKKKYFDCIVISPSDPHPLFQLLKSALTSEIDDREVFTRGIDYSYYYEEVEEIE